MTAYPVLSALATAAAPNFVLDRGDAIPALLGRHEDFLIVAGLAGTSVRIASLVAQGVQFDVCINTVETVERTTGKPYPLNPKAQPVPAGVPELMSLAERGYTVIRP